MKLFVKQRFIALTDTYNIYDENNKVKYVVKADLISIGRRFRVFNKKDKLIGIIQQKIISFMPRYDIEIDGEQAGFIRKRITFFTPGFEIQYKNLKVDGDIFHLNYDITDDGDLVGKVRKKLIALRDEYIIDIDDEANEIEILMLVIVIDALSDAKSKMSIIDDDD